MRWYKLLLAGSSLALSLAAMAEEAPADERTAAYREFRSVFDAGDYPAALPLASRVVEITASTHGRDALELANPLTNLATTYYRMRQYEPALDTYRRAVELLETHAEPTDPRLVRPLQGMGAVLHAMQRDADAIVPLKRAVDITRNRDGLHAEAQLPLLKALVESYRAAGRHEDAGREQQFAFNVAETAYGKDDLRILPQLHDLAAWNEFMGRYTAARLLYTRAVQIADNTEPGSLQAVDGLRGIARCFRLAFMFGENEESMAVATEMPNTLAAPLLAQVVSAPSTEGERALRVALQRLVAKGGPAAQRGQVLVDLGDWYRTADKKQRALESWGEAWKALAEAGDTRLLEQPEPVIYRPPGIAVSRHQEDPQANLEQVVELNVSVGADGSLKQAVVANPAPERESAEKAVLNAIKRAVWRPAFRDGVAVETNGHVYREPVYVKRPKEDKA